LQTALESRPEFQGPSQEIRVAETIAAVHQALVTTPQNLDTPLGLIFHWDPTLQEDLSQVQWLKAQYPQLKLLVLTLTIDAVSLQTWQSWGVDGFWKQGGSIEGLIATLEQIFVGVFHWPTLPPASPMSQQVTAESLRPTSGDRSQGWVQSWFEDLCRSGIQQVDQALDQGNLSESGPISWLDHQLAQGQQRELRMARWLLQSAVGRDPAPVAVAAPASRQLPPATGSISNPTAPGPRQLSLSLSLEEGQNGPPETPFSPPIPVLSPETLTSQNLQAILFDQITAKLRSNLINLTAIPLEIDILSLSKKRELLVVVLRCLGDRLTDLRQSKLTPEQLTSRQEVVVQDLWQTALTDFFGKYAVLSLPLLSNPSNTKDQKPLTVPANPIDLVPKLLEPRSAELVYTAILRRIPYLEAILQTLIFKAPIAIDGVDYRPHSPEALARLGQITENLVLQVANGVVQPLLNTFGDVEAIKHTFYNQRLLSTREIERFRNDLSWKYRFVYYFEEPRNIYESRYWLLTLGDQGIRRIAVYAPRQEELAQVEGVQQTITFGLEVRDAIAPRLQALTAWVGTGIVYLLTQVVGRAIGLIGRGILQGIGNSWQDGRFTRKS
jgi:hypothetical protein